MSFLGLVGAPVQTLSYPAYQALKAAAPALGAALSAAEGAAVASLAAQGAAVLGAGALGWMAGRAIANQLGLEDAAPELVPYLKGGNPGQRVRINFLVKQKFNPTLSSSIDVTAPFAGVLRQQLTANDDIYYFLSAAAPAVVAMVQFSRGTGNEPTVEITNFVSLDGQPVTGLKPVPVPRPREPFVPLRYPATVPAFPGTPAFPITPTVVPTPGNDPDEDNKFIEPAITVQIPEIGAQIQFTPTGVRLGGYRNPETIPFTPPKAFIPPGTPPPASDPCPCPEEGGKADEIICRVKTLQTEILDDGYNFTTVIIPAGVGASVTGITTEITQANVFLTQQPLNGKKQSYDAIDSEVVYGGWFSWTKEGRAGERIILNFEENSFYPPPGADGFKYACNDAYEASGSYVKRDKRPYIDLC